MNPFEMVVLIVAIVAFAGVAKARFGHARLDDDQPAATGNDDAKRLRDEVRTLKERIAVLERIATDREGSLDREIERLRDR